MTTGQAVVIVDKPVHVGDIRFLQLFTVTIAPAPLFVVGRAPRFTVVARVTPPTNLL